MKLVYLCSTIRSPVSLAIVSPASIHGIITDFLYTECGHMVTEYWAPPQKIAQSLVNIQCNMLTQHVECVSGWTSHIKNEINGTAWFRMEIRRIVSYVGIRKTSRTHF